MNPRPFTCRKSSFFLLFLGDWTSDLAVQVAGMEEEIKHQSRAWFVAWRALPVSGHIRCSMCWHFKGFCVFLPISKLKNIFFLAWKSQEFRRRLICLRIWYAFPDNTCEMLQFNWPIQLLLMAILFQDYFGPFPLLLLQSWYGKSHILKRNGEAAALNTWMVPATIPSPSV